MSKITLHVHWNIKREKKKIGKIQILTYIYIYVYIYIYIYIYTDIWTKSHFMYRNMKREKENKGKNFFYMCIYWNVPQTLFWNDIYFMRENVKVKMLQKCIFELIYDYLHMRATFQGKFKLKLQYLQSDWSKFKFERSNWVSNV